MATPERTAAPLIAAIPFALIDAPLDYILADNSRQRGICSALRRIAGHGQIQRAIANSMIVYLQRDLPLHHQDEDEDLFPAMRKRALPEDDLDAALTRLSDDHRQAEGLAGDIVTALAAQPAGKAVKLARSTREAMLAYAASEHRHLAIENSIILAIARIRLTRGDLKSMSASMKKRRGVLS